MSDPAKQPLLADIRREWGALHAELREMIAARWDLARLEIQADLLAAKRLMFAGLIAVVLALTALPLLAVCAADALGGWLEMSRGRWLLVFAAALLLIACVGSCAAWRRFRRRFTGLRETREELREDLLWLQELAAEHGKSP